MARPRKPPLDPAICKKIRAMWRQKPRPTIPTIAKEVGLSEWATKVWIDGNLTCMGKDPSWKPIGEWPTMPEKFEDDPRAIKSDGRVIVRPVYATGSGFAGVSTLAGSYRAKR